MGEMSRVIIAIIKTEKDLCIFCERRKRDTKNRATNTENLVPAIINKMVPYQNFQKLRLSYRIDYQDSYFFIKEKLPPGTVIH
jgi:thioredoxin-related protein